MDVDIVSDSELSVVVSDSESDESSLELITLKINNNKSSSTLPNIVKIFNPKKNPQIKSSHIKVYINI